jgi:hypothetical protein
MALKVGDAAQTRRICHAHADRGVRVRPIPPVAPVRALQCPLSQNKIINIGRENIRLFLVQIVLCVEYDVISCSLVEVYENLGENLLPPSSG